MRKSQALGAVALATAALTMAGPAGAASFPNKDITFMIPYGPGGGFDTYVRRIAPIMEKYLPNKVNVIPKNVPGAGGRKALNVLWRDKHPGYTICVFNMPGMMLDKLRGKKNAYNIEKFTWLGRIAQSKYAMTVGTKSGYNSIADLKKAKELKYAVTSTASGSYVAGNIMASTMGLNVKFLTGYKGSAKISLSIIRGDTDLSLFNIRSFEKWAKGGDLKALAVFVPGKSPLEGIPTANEIGYPSLANITIERVVGAAPGVSEDVQKILSDALLKAVKSDTIQAWHKKTGRPIDPLSGPDTAKMLQDRYKFLEKYKDVLVK